MQQVPSSNSLEYIAAFQQDLNNLIQYEDFHFRVTFLVQIQLVPLVSSPTYLAVLF